MRLRTFIATSMLDAMEQVRAALGDDAIIVSSVEGENGGFEVTATVDGRSSADESNEANLSLEDILRDRLTNTSRRPRRSQRIPPKERMTRTPGCRLPRPIPWRPWLSTKTC